ncbi:hypothetical protein ACOTAH_12315, partial [Mannheimia haemolytica]|uniref:hypothetical protein n=1 Tax=Mannheimia haemolytica TaxID=75985 RepID=UPI001F37EFD5
RTKRNDALEINFKSFTTVRRCVLRIIGKNKNNASGFCKKFEKRSFLQIFNTKRSFYRQNF